MSSRGRRAEIQVSALLLTQAPPPAISKPLLKSLVHFQPSSCSCSLSAGIWVQPAFLSWDSLLPAHSPAQKALMFAVPPLAQREICLQEGGEWLLPVLRLQLSFERKGLPAPALQVLGLSCPGLLLSSLPTLAEKSQGLVSPIHSSTSWLYFPGLTGICCHGPSSE